MRLTLRTLLAYLDDTLEPLEIKTIGQKVAESETAQELIARIKQVTRRRRLTTPPATGPNSFDPNLVAEYLDNELSSEQVAELEKISLESDVHLAEVAACHQILTLVLGEPAVVPPTAKERMYALVQGREAIPFRKAAAPAGAAAGAAGDHDADDTLLLGLPLYRRGTWLRWALPVAGVLLLAVVGVALWQLAAGMQHPQQVASNPPPQPPERPEGDQERLPEKPAEGKPKDPEKPTEDNRKPTTTEIKTPADTPAKPPEREPEKEPDRKASASPESRKQPPAKERAAVGNYHFAPSSLPSILVQRKSGPGGWKRVKAGDRVSTSDRLVSLPGYASELRLDCGLHLLLRGHVKEFSLPEVSEMDYLQESAVVLHKPRDTDADLTLERGRLYLSNHKARGDVVVRLRFADQVWDLTLQPDAEMVVDLLRHNSAAVDYKQGEQPIATLHLLLQQGKGGVAHDTSVYPDLFVPGPAYFRWDNKPSPRARGPENVTRETLDKVRPMFSRVPPANAPEAADMERALNSVSQRMLLDKDPVVTLQEVLQDNIDPAKKGTLMQHRLAVYCLGALDAVKELLEVLASPDPLQAVDRQAAIFTLRRWLARDADQWRKLYNPDKKTGDLLNQRYTTEEAERIVALLHDFTYDDIHKVETFEQLAKDVSSEKVALSELAAWWLFRLTRFFKVELGSLNNFNAAAPREYKKAVADEVIKRVEDHSLPRSEKGNAGPPPGGPRPPPKTGPGTGNGPPRPRK